MGENDTRVEILREVCYPLHQLNTSGIWRAEDPSVFSLPQLITQILLSLFILRVSILLLKPLHQPPMVAEILGGVLLGSSGMLSGQQIIHTHLFPIESRITLETLANLGLVCEIFLVALEIDLNIIRRATLKTYCFVILGFVFSLPAGYGLFLGVKPKPSNHGGAFFWAIALSCTDYTTLVQILGQVKQKRSDLGQTALSTSLINNFFCWILMVTLISKLQKSYHRIIISTTVLVLVCFFIIRPVLKMLNRYAGEEYCQWHLGFVLASLMTLSMIADRCGCHSITGAFLFGVVVPNGALKVSIQEKVKDFNSGFFMPLFFLALGLRVKVEEIAYGTTWKKGLLNIVFALEPMLVATYTVSLFCMTAFDGLSLGLLLNSKGLFSITILCTGHDLKALDNQTFSIILVSFWSMTVLTGPFMTLFYKKSIARSLQGKKGEDRLNVLACVHSTDSISGIVKLFQTSHPSIRTPISIFAVHLIGLTTGRDSPKLIQLKKGMSKLHSMSAFEILEEDNHLSIQKYILTSEFDTMHERICELIEDFNVTFVILPFHKNANTEVEKIQMSQVNRNLLENSACSLGLLVDFQSGASTSTSQHTAQEQFLAMLFIGGPDDREALACAWRMMRHLGARLTVVRFVSGEQNASDQQILHSPLHNREKVLDDIYLAKFRNDSKFYSSITYMEKVTKNGEETLKAIGTMENQKFDLFIVGRRGGTHSVFTSGLTGWSDRPELGALGDLLVSSVFASNSAVLIVQHHREGSGGKETDHGGNEENQPNIIIATS